MNCGTDDERSDFFAFNDYSWCDPSSFIQSQWDQKVKNFTGYGIPIFLSEYGCPATPVRTWEETAALYNQNEMTAVYSGGLAYEYSVEDNKAFGMAQINADGTVTIGPSFTTYQKQLAANPSPSGNGGFNSTSGASACPAKSGNWNVTSDALPAIPNNAKSFMTKGAGNPVGLKGPGSQDASGSGTSPGTATSGSGTVTGVAAGASSTTSSAAAGTFQPAFNQAPMIVGSVVMVLTLFGGFLL